MQLGIDQIGSQPKTMTYSWVKQRLRKPALSQVLGIEGISFSIHTLYAICKGWRSSPHGFTPVNISRVMHPKLQISAFGFGFMLNISGAI